MAGERYKEMDSQNKRRAALGIRVNVFENGRDSFFGGDNTWYIRDSSFSSYANQLCSFVGDDFLSRTDRWKMLRRARSFLSRRELSPDSDYIPPLYRKKNKISTALDCFPALQHSYSSPLPYHVLARKHGVEVPRDYSSPCYLDFCYNPDGASKKARFNDLSRSGSIRLDPVDSVRQLFLYRIRIQRCISWGYAVGLVPLMMTVTIFHRWHPLRGLLNVLSKAWNHFFNASTAAVKRSKKMGLVGYIRRAEETINNGSHEEGYNSGWHPHYHVILFVPADKVSVVSSMERELQEAWFHSVNLYFEREFGEPIDPSYEKSFLKHGLYFSKVEKGEQGFKVGGSIDLLTKDTHSTSTREPDCSEDGRGAILGDSVADDLTIGCDSDNIPISPRARVATQPGTTSTAQSRTAIDTSDGIYELRHVDDSEYMAKVFGCSASSLYCGDTELTSGSKGSRVPFDLLLEDTAENIDLWVEYALSTKGVRCFVFSQGLEKRVKEYFDEHPDRDPIPKFTKSNKVIAQLDSRIYKIVEKNFKVDEMMRVAVQGYDALCDWFREFYHELGLPDSAITEDKLPLPPNSRTVFGDIIHATSSASILQEVLKKSTTTSSSSAASSSSSPSTDKSSSTTSADTHSSKLPPLMLPLDFETPSASESTSASASNISADTSSVVATSSSTPSAESGTSDEVVDKAAQRAAYLSKARKQAVEDRNLKGQLSLFHDGVDQVLMRRTKSGRIRRKYVTVIPEVDIPESLRDESDVKAKPVPKSTSMSSLIFHVPYREIGPEDPLYRPLMNDEELEEVCGKYAYLLEQDPSDTRSRREFLENLIQTYRDMDKFKKAIPLEDFYCFIDYLHLKVKEEKELEEREKEWEKEWERVLPELEAQSKKDMAEADAYFAQQRAELESAEVEEDEQPAAAVEPEEIKDTAEEAVINLDLELSSEQPAQSDEPTINFDIEVASSDLSDSERLMAMINDPNSVLARAIEVSRSPHYPAWYRTLVNNRARDIIRETTSIDPDSKLLMQFDAMSDADKSSDVPESLLDFLFVDDDPAVRAKSDKYSNENSLEARVAEVSNSKWYSEWYRKRLQKQLRATRDVAPRKSDSVAPPKSAREIAEDKRLLDIFLEEAEKLKAQAAAQEVAELRDSSVKGHSNIIFRHRKDRGD